MRLFPASDTSMTGAVVTSESIESEQNLINPVTEVWGRLFMGQELGVGVHIS